MIWLAVYMTIGIAFAAVAYAMARDGAANVNHIDLVLLFALWPVCVLATVTRWLLSPVAPRHR